MVGDVGVAVAVDVLLTCGMMKLLLFLSPPFFLQSEGAANKAFELESKYEASLSSGEERLREVPGSPHDVEKAFVLPKDRYH